VVEDMKLTWVVCAVTGGQEYRVDALVDSYDIDVFLAVANLIVIDSDTAEEDRSSKR